MAATVTTLATFNGTDGYDPSGAFYMDAAGDIFSTTFDDGGEVFEIVKTSSGYASTPTVIARFDKTDGWYPAMGPTADAAGDLFGTTIDGGTDNEGTVYELKKTASGYAAAPTVLYSFDGSEGDSPISSLTMDANGDLFGTATEGGSGGGGTIFEIKKTANGYAATPTVLYSFDQSSGTYQPQGGLTMDANGDLFGTTAGGGTDKKGTIFEMVKTASGYAAPVTLTSLVGRNGNYPASTMIMDAAGDLFGTTLQGGAHDYGTVFELKKTASGYATYATTLVKFDMTDGETPVGSLLMDAAGDLFGVTGAGGANGDGVIFEIKKTTTGYATTPTIVASLTSANSIIQGGLAVDAAGNFLGATEYGGSDNDGTIFEVTNTGYVTSLPKVAFAASATVGKTTSAGTAVALTGTVSDTGSTIASVDIYNGAINAADLIGTATVSGGTWTLSTTLAAGNYGTLKAVVTGTDGGTATASAPYHIQAKVSGEPYKSAENLYNSAGNVTSRTEYNASGGIYHNETWTYDSSGDIEYTVNTNSTGYHTTTAYESGLTLSSASGGKDTFLFNGAFGTETLADFSSFLGGSTHDHVSLPTSDFTSFSQMLAATTFSGGNAIVTASNGDKLIIDNITQAQLASHPGEFSFHGNTGT